MLFTEKTNKAIEKATILHANQYRKDGKMPYIIHPLSVALIVREFSNDEDIIIATIMHDTIEDTPYVLAELEHDFGSRVAELVHGVTEHKFKDHHELSWQERKNEMLAVLKTAEEGVLLVRAADNMHNLISLMEFYNNVGESALKKFHASIEDKLAYDQDVLTILHEHLQSPIVAEYQKLYEKAVETFS